MEEDTKKTSTVKFILLILPNDEINEIINSLNSKQTWFNWIQYLMLFIYGSKIRWNMMKIMLNQSILFFQAVDARVNSICWKWYTTLYKNHCFITVKTQKSRVFFSLNYRNISDKYRWTQFLPVLEVNLEKKKAALFK